MTLPQNFQQALIAVYRENPCQVLPNALWKSLPWADQFKTDFKIESDRVTQLRAWDHQRLMLYWSRDRNSQDIPFAASQIFEFALLHKDFETTLPLEDYPERHLSFRLLHKMETVPASKLPDGFSFAIANPINQARAISDLIGNCYEDIHPSPETVLSWCDHPAFNADLWVWIRDEARGTPAALGIAEFAPTIAEGSLEWIQVLPDYRCRGLGQHLVCELLTRLQTRAEFTTVAGQVDNANRPDTLYRRCGFEGDDIWWVLGR